MEFMIIMIPAAYRDNKQPDWETPDPKAMEKMGQFNERLAKSVKIVSLNGLHPLTKGTRLSFSQGKATITDGPFVETNEVFGGYWMVEAESQEQVVKLMQGCPAEDGDIIEIRQIFGEEDFALRK